MYKRAPPRTCANPLFAEWLGEWLDKEREKDSNFKFVLQKAYQNMQDFPEVLSSGKDAMRVKGIGQKIADMLDRKMQQSGVNSGAGGHVLGGGPPGQPAFSQGAPGSSQQQDSAPKAAPKKRKKAGDPPPEGANEADPAQPAKRKRAPKPYVPEYRSGAYALLVTLYLEKYGPARNDGMLKADLMRKAEEHCNSSFAEASDKNGWYTAWDAMTKLRDKGLVCKLGNPAVYALTEPDGDNLAKALVESGQRSGPEADGARSFPGAKRPEEPTVISGSAPPRGEAGSFIRSEDLGQYLAERRATSGKPPPAPKAPASQDRDLDSARRPPARPAPPSDGPICLDSDSDDGAPPSSNPVRRGSFSQPLGNATTSAIHAAFQFEYLEEEALVSSNKERAQVRLSGSDLQLRIRFHIRQSGHPFVMSHVVDRSLAPVDGYLTGWLRDEIAPARCPGIDVAALTAPPPVPPSPSGKGKGKAKEAAPAVPRAAPPPADYVSKQPLPSQAIPKPASSNLSKSGTASAPAALGTGPKVNEFRGQPIVLKRGTYDVVLVLDMRENKTRQYAAVQERDWMLERLYTKGIRAETKVMELGDFCWIAKPKSSNGPVDEIVLDFVVERKALDDLKMSIHEGRFEEQKFRMVNSGVNNVIYVIEGMIPRNDPSWAEHLKKTYSAMSLLQVGHGFFVKQTLNKDDTLNYLEQLTIWIQQLYLTEDIYAIPGGSLQKSDWHEVRAHAERRDSRRYHVPFSAFNELNSKSRNLLLRDAYIKQLLCIRGISVEKAVSIATKFPTMRSLLDSLSKQPSDSARVKLLIGVTEEAAPTRRKIGKAIAERIIEVLCAPVYKQKSVAATADSGDM